MKADLTEYSSVPIDKVDADKGMPFPLYIFLKLNNRLIPLRHENDPLFSKKDELLRYNLRELWTPIYYYDRFKQLLEMEPKSEEAQLVHDVLKDQQLPPEVKSQALAALSQDMLSNIHKLTAASEADREEGMRKCKEIADEILTVAAAHDSVYDEILTLRQSKEDIEHSVAVGSLGVMFAMAIGIADEVVLGDIIMAAIFHDIGLVHVEPQARQKSESERTPAEEEQYRAHVEKSLEVVRISKPRLNERVYMMVAQHHENYDGTGYPKALKGEQIDELSQVMNMANWFEDLVLGNITGAPISPAEAFDMIYASMEEGSKQPIDPSLIERIFQFMTEQKDEFERKKAELEKSVMKKAQETSVSSAAAAPVAVQAEAGAAETAQTETTQPAEGVEGTEPAAESEEEAAEEPTEEPKSA